MRNLEEARLFWDDFAEEYAEIQEESQVNIQRDVSSFLLAKKYCLRILFWIWRVG
jgi:hypothetical protein